MTDGNVNFHGDEQTGNGFSTQWRDEGADIERQLMNSQVLSRETGINRSRKWNESQSEFKHSLTFRVRRCTHSQCIRLYVYIRVCCRSNETRAPIANPPNSAQLQGTTQAYHSPSYIRVRAVVWECGEGEIDKHTDTQTAMANIHFASATTRAIYNNDQLPRASLHTTDQLSIDCFVSTQTLPTL